MVLVRIGLSVAIRALEKPRSCQDLCGMSRNSAAPPCLMSNQVWLKTRPPIRRPPGGTSDTLWKARRDVIRIVRTLIFHFVHE